MAVVVGSWMGSYQGLEVVCRMCWKGHTDATSAPTLPWLRPLSESTGGMAVGVGLARLHGLPEKRVQASHRGARWGW